MTRGQKPAPAAIHRKGIDIQMKKIIGIMLICVLLGSIKNTAAAEDAIPAEWNLRISFTPAYHAGFTTIPLEQGNFKNIAYLDVENVTIDIDGTGMRLEDALREGYVSVDDLISDARQDASLGLCHEEAKSKNGLTEFTYHYGEFNLRYIYDLYETPKDGQRLIADFLIYEARSEPHFLPVDEKTQDFIDYEDWGLDFEISRLDSSGITIQCSQSGGQQIGKLNAGVPVLSRKDPDTLALEQVQPLTEEGQPVPFTGNKHWEPAPDGFLTMGGTKELSYDFARLYGQLPAGDYVLSLQIVDLYDEGEVHPLMRNYHDEQWYDIEFTIYR